ncbi:hypothetical protein [Maribacter sp. 2308TA10-17]|uniref:hypothetical protein n=1 Tax=Maribacter sp. 2308TA10-17 TaxID=3386276 RepID=UPI0039BCC344
MIKEKIKTEHAILRIEIADDWSSNDFAALFESTSLLYQLFIEIDSIQHYPVGFFKDTPKPKDLESVIELNSELYKKMRFSSTYENSEKVESLGKLKRLDGPVISMDRNNLIIGEIQYASPGFSDFIGLGKILEQVFSLIQYYFPNKKERLENSIMEQDLLSKKIENLKSLGYSKKELKNFIDVRNSTILNLAELHQHRKITDFKIKEYLD